MSSHTHKTSKGPIQKGGSDRSHGKDEHAHANHHAMNKEHGTSFYGPETDECHHGGKATGGAPSAAQNEKHQNDRTPKKAID